MTHLSVRDGYRHWAATYDDSPNPLVSLIDRHLDLADFSGARVIDVGCGTGQRARKLGAIGVDLSFEMLAKSHTTVVQADARDLPFPDEVADVVLCTLALAYVSQPREAMIELRRIARKGATIIAADMHPRAVAAGWKRSFRDGDASYEIESHPYSFDDLVLDGLTLVHARDLYFGEPERAIYLHSGKISLFEDACRVPAAWIRRWRRL